MNKIVDKQKKLGVQQSLMPWKRNIGGKKKKKKTISYYNLGIPVW